jgi:hypothetical protein
LFALARHPARRLQAFQDRRERQRLLAVIDQPLAKPRQHRGIKERIADVAIQREVPARVILQHLQRLTVGDILEELQQRHAQREHRLDGGPAVLGAETGSEGGAGGDQPRINHLGEQAVAILWGEEFCGPGGEAEERLLRRKFR